jgi:hypothetical protein
VVRPTNQSVKRCDGPFGDLLRSFHVYLTQYSLGNPMNWKSVASQTPFMAILLGPSLPTRYTNAIVATQLRCPDEKAHSAEPVASFLLGTVRSRVECSLHDLRP